MFCFYCDCLGHTEQLCEKLFSAKIDDGERLLGAELRDDMRRGGGSSGNKWLRPGPDLVNQNRPSAKPNVPTANPTNHAVNISVSTFPGSVVNLLPTISGAHNIMHAAVNIPAGGPTQNLNNNQLSVIAPNQLQGANLSHDTEADPRKRRRSASTLYGSSSLP